MMGRQPPGAMGRPGAGGRPMGGPGFGPGMMMPAAKSKDFGAAFRRLLGELRPLINGRVS